MSTILHLEQVHKDFILKTRGKQGEKSSRLTILQDLSLEVKKGERIAILGKSGSGKSTFLSLVAGLDQPTSGSIVLSGIDIANLPERKLADYRSRKIAIIFQQFHLLPHLTALDNVSLPLELMQLDESKEQILREASQALKTVGLEYRMDHFPRELSGGEQQRVAIARALVVKPDLLLADEPTGNLDNQTNQEVTEQFFQVVKENQLTLLLVTHDESIAKKCDHRYFLNQGQLTKLK